MPKFRALRTGQYGGCLRKEGVKFDATDEFAERLKKSKEPWAELVTAKDAEPEPEQEEGTLLSEDKPKSEGPKSVIDQHKEVLASEQGVKPEDVGVEIL